MTHALEIREGKASFVYNSQNGNPWHKLGTPFDGYLSIDEALRLSGADFEVYPAPITAITPDGVVEIPDKIATMRTLPTGQAQNLGILGTGYVIVQNRTGLERAYDIVGASDGEAHLDTAGLLFDGRRFFAYIRLDDLYLDPTGINDKIERGLAVYLSHDGSIAVTYAFTDMRVVCKNTVTFAVENAQRLLKARHTATVDERISKEEAQRVLGVSSKWADAFKRQAERLLAVRYTPDKFEWVLRGTFPAPKNATERQERNAAATREQVRSIFESPANSGGFGQNGWTMYNAIGEYLDHGREASPTDRAVASITPGSWVFNRKEKAARLILA